MDKEIIVAGIGGLSAMVVGWLGYLAARSKKVKEAESETKQMARELEFQSFSLGFSEFIEEWAAISRDFTSLIEETEIDRCLILRAWNGSLDPRWTTAVYQVRESGQSPVPYIHTEIDQDYRGRLMDIMGHGNIYFDVSELQDSLIKRIYEAEGVTHSYWAHIVSFDLAHSNMDSKAIVYASFSTHNNEGISEATRTRCGLLVSRLKGIAMNFHAEHKTGAWPSHLGA